MELLQNKLIVYDGACPLCLSLRDKVLRWGIFPQSKVANYYELPDAQAAQIDPERFRNEMAVIDTDGGSTIYGADGIRKIFSEKWVLAKLFFSIPGIMRPIRFIYRTLAHNRYVISTPRKDMPVCNCEPDAPAISHVAYLGFCTVVAVLVTFFFGSGLAIYDSTVTALGSGIGMLLVAGTGWLLQGLHAWLAFGENRFQYLRHMCTVMRMGVMPLLPAAILMYIFDDLSPWVPFLSVVWSSGMMLRQHYLRIWRLSASQGWTFSWFLALQCTALGWIIFIVEYPSLFGI
jgi:predicted DCC family thiol-disulfide oxidoreductase YuxK